MLLSSNHTASRFGLPTSTVSATTLTGINNNSITVGIKVYVDGTLSSHQNVMKVGSLSVDVDNTNVKITNDTESYNVSVLPLANRWVSIMLTFNSGIVEMYLDGIMVELIDLKAGGTTLTNTGSLTLFDNGLVSGDTYVQMVAEDFRLYNNVLDVSRVYQYSRGNGVLN